MSSQPQPRGLGSSVSPAPNQTAGGGLRNLYRQEFDRVHRDFVATGSGLAALSDRTRLVDKLALTLWEQSLPSRPHCGYALVAVGGYGRCELFPHSDVDLLFLTEDEEKRNQIKDGVNNICQQIWDCGLRASPSTHPIADCARLNQENIEFTLSLLD